MKMGFLSTVTGSISAFFPTPHGNSDKKKLLEIIKTS
jgi:hypothetical protein